jgi:hypothetical protein
MASKTVEAGGTEPRGADVNAADNDGQTLCLTRRGHDAIAQFLSKAGAQ